MFTTKNLFAAAGKHFLVALGAIVIASGIAIVLSGQITSISKQAAKDRSAALSMSERTAHFSMLKNEVALVGNNDQKIKEAFIPSNNILAFVSVIKSLALKNGVIQAFHFSSPVPGTIGTVIPLDSISYQNSITASAPLFVEYLRDFEQLPYFTKIDSLTISSIGGDWRTNAVVSLSASVAAHPAQ